MSEIGIKDQRFGVEVEFTGITRKEAEQALGALVRIPSFRAGYMINGRFRIEKGKRGL